MQFHNGAASVDGWIVKQLGSKKFRCSDGTTEAICWLTDAAAGALTAGQMSISVQTDNHGVQQVIKVAGRKMTYEDGDVNYSVAWNFDTNVPADDRMEVEETAGRTGETIDVLDAVNLTQYVIVDAGDTVWTSFGATDVTTTNFVAGDEYIITNVGDTDFTLIGAASNTVGERFTATGIGGGTTGTAHETIFTMANAPGTGTGTVGEFVAETTFGT